MANSLQTIMRMSAVMYADQHQTTRSAKTVERTFIEAVLVAANNTPLSVEQIITALQEDFSLTYQEPEILPIITDEKYFVCILSDKEKRNTYYLPHQRYERLSEKEERGIEKMVEIYVAQQQAGIDPNTLKELLYKYLYNLLNTNISAYRQLLEKNAKNISPVIKSDSLDEKEIDYINAFLNWDNEIKDEALFALISCCVDYASAINRVDQNDVFKALKNKCLYLDNSLLYRALGINGSFRQSRLNNLLQRCRQSGQKLFISSITRKEFFETITYHINELNQSTPFGRINPRLFSKFTNGHGFYQYYHEWRRNRDTYGFKSLELHIHTEYDQLLKRFAITEDFKQPFNIDDSAHIIDKYSDEIQQYKTKKQQHLHENDACNMLWIEKSRGNNDHNIRDTKYYFVTSDRRLQEWDLAHSQNQPITMLPSQWLALLLKFYSRSTDDYKCFVSFLTIPKEKSDVTFQELQETLAGISEITEDFALQDDIVSALLEIEDTNQYRTRDAAKKFAKEKLEDKYIAQIKATEEAHAEKIAEVQSEALQQLSVQQIEAEKKLDAIKEELTRRDEIYRVEKLKDSIQEIKRNINELQQKKQLIENIVADRAGILKRSVGLALVSLLVIWSVLIVKVGWDIMEMWTYIVGSALTVSPIVASLIFDKTPNPRALFKRYEKYLLNKLCQSYDYNDTMLADCEQTLISLEDQLKKKEKE